VGEWVGIIVRDNGVGLPESFNLETASSLGLRLVRALTRQLGGRIEFLRENPGLRVCLNFSGRSPS
jgi:two-component sensor histidine kinase